MEVSKQSVEAQARGMFSFSGRRGRKSYVLSIVGLSCLALLAVVVSTLLAFISSGLSLVFLVPTLIALYVGSMLVSAQRFRDFGQSGCWVFVFLIPYVGFAVALALCFIPPNPGANKYGEQP